MEVRIQEMLASKRGEGVHSTALEANAASNDEVSRLRVEEVHELLAPAYDQAGEGEEEEAGAPRVKTEPTAVKPEPMC